MINALHIDAHMFQHPEQNLANSQTIVARRPLSERVAREKLPLPFKAWHLSSESRPQSSSLPSRQSGRNWGMYSPASHTKFRDSSLSDTEWGATSTCSGHRHSACILAENDISDISCDMRGNVSTLSRSSSSSTQRSDNLVSIEDRYLHRLFDRKNQLKVKLAHLNTQLLDLLHEEWKITGVVPEGYDFLSTTTGRSSQRLKSTSYPLSREIIQRANTFSRVNYKHPTLGRRNTAAVADFSGKEPLTTNQRDRVESTPNTEKCSLSTVHANNQILTTNTSSVRLRLALHQPTCPENPAEVDVNPMITCSAHAIKLQPNVNLPSQTMTQSSHQSPNDRHVVCRLFDNENTFLQEDREIQQALNKLQLRRLEVDYAVLSELYTIHKKRAAETKRAAYRIAYKSNFRKLKEIEKQMDQLRTQFGCCSDGDSKSTGSQNVSRSRRRSWMPFYKKGCNWARKKLHGVNSRTPSVQCIYYSPYSTPSTPTLTDRIRSDLAYPVAASSLNNMLLHSETENSTSSVKAVAKPQRRPTLPLLGFLPPSQEPTQSGDAPVLDKKVNAVSEQSWSGGNFHPKQQFTSDSKPILLSPTKDPPFQTVEAESRTPCLQPSPSLDDYNEAFWPSSMSATPVNLDNGELRVPLHKEAMLPKCTDNGIPIRNLVVINSLQSRHKPKQVRSLTNLADEVFLEDSPINQVEYREKSSPCKPVKRCFSFCTMELWLSDNSTVPYPKGQPPHLCKYQEFTPPQRDRPYCNPTKVASLFHTIKFTSDTKDSLQRGKQIHHAATSSHTSSSNWSTSGCSCMSSNTGSSSCDFKHGTSEFTLQTSFSPVNHEDGEFIFNQKYSALPPTKNDFQSVRFTGNQNRIPFIKEETYSPHATNLRVNCICSCLSEHGDQCVDGFSCTGNSLPRCERHNYSSAPDTDDGVSLTDHASPSSDNQGDVFLSSIHSQKITSCDRFQHPTDELKAHSNVIADMPFSTQALSPTTLSLLKQPSFRIGAENHGTATMIKKHRRRSFLPSAKPFMRNWVKRRSEILTRIKNLGIGDG